jgi:hypothetical protein
VTDESAAPMGFVVYADELDGRASWQWTWKSLLAALTWHLPNVRQYHGPLIGTLQADRTDQHRAVCFVRFTPATDLTRRKRSA